MTIYENRHSINYSRRACGPGGGRGGGEGSLCVMMCVWGGPCAYVCACVCVCVCVCVGRGRDNNMYSPPSRTACYYCMACIIHTRLLSLYSPPPPPAVHANVLIWRLHTAFSKCTLLLLFLFLLLNFSFSLALFLSVSFSLPFSLFLSLSFFFSFFLSTFTNAILCKSWPPKWKIERSIFFLFHKKSRLHLEIAFLWHYRKSSHNILKYFNNISADTY